MNTGLVYEYSHLTIDGLDHHLFAELCSTRLTNNHVVFNQHPHTKASWAYDLPQYIANIVYRSQMSMNIAIVALILAERLQDALIRKGICPEHKIEDAGCLWLVSYIVAAKLVHDEQPPLKYWEAVSGNRYKGGDLAQLERQFYSILDWKIQVDKSTFDHNFVDMMDRYLGWLENRSLPAAPPPIYRKTSFLRRQKTPRDDATIKPLLPTVMLLRGETRELIPTINAEEEALFSRAMSHSSPGRGQSGYLSAYKLPLLSVVH
ncbi:hypothetical protein CPC08DRAFT_719389 [Agrocybe pediades]|nr:hypothetical protein CPC08DRAFT_719389 [Agrocybe pediades]